MSEAAKFWTLPLIVVLSLGVLWEAAPRLFAISPQFFPPLSTVLADAASPAIWPFLLRSLGRTFAETILGFVSGAAFGIACGILFSQVRTAERVLFPLFVVSQTIPVIAFGALIIIWFGNTIVSKIVIAFYLTFFPVTVNTHSGLNACDPQKINMLRSFGASRLKIFWKLQFPAALPAIAVALRLGISLSLIGAIVGEWFGDNLGLGVMLIQAMYTEHVARLWAIIIACGLLGSSLYGLVAIFERRFIWWRGD